MTNLSKQNPWISYPKSKVRPHCDNAHYTVITIAAVWAIEILSQHGACWAAVTDYSSYSFGATLEFWPLLTYYTFSAQYWKIDNHWLLIVLHLQQSTDTLGSLHHNKKKGYQSKDRHQKYSALTKALTSEQECCSLGFALLLATAPK